MKKTITTLAIVLLVVVVYSCKKHSDETTLTTGTVYLDLPPTVDNYHFADSGFASRNSNYVATLGRVLFYDSHLSLNNAISCGSCHKQSASFADNVAFSTGYEGRLTKRNSPMIANLLGDQPRSNVKSMNMIPLFWDGREILLTNLISRPVTNHVEMGIDDFNSLPSKLSALPYYSALFKNAYGDTQITSQRIADAVSVFIISIQSNNSRFDLFAKRLTSNMITSSSIAAAATGLLTTQELAGFNLFTNTYNCEGCHHIFTNFYSISDMRDIGLDAVYVDNGSGTITGDTYDNGKFKVPKLKNVALSAPYMHDGRYKTLDEVIDHYSHGIQNSPNLDRELTDSAGHPMQMNINDNNKQALIAFLQTMTDFDVVSDPKFANPFKVK
ncbi:MAG: cytochrome-c peroxidase [Flavipsychrobacter sp.]|nr:cytochrome-c peroxidase [Flavipsychrobacter sp.]